MKKLFTILILMGLIFISGCTSNKDSRQTPTNNGVMIESFSPSISDIDPEVDVVLPIIIKNVGEKTARNVNVELFGLTEGWTILPGRTLTTISTMSPADSSRDIEGQEEYMDWTIKGPKKPVEITYNMEARVSYDYETDSESLIRIVSSNYFKEKNEKGGLVSSDYSGGPLSVNVKVPSAVISTGYVPLIFEIQNQAGGTAFIGSVSSPELNKISLEVEGADCSGKTEVILVSGKSGLLSCKITPQADVERFEDVSISLKLTYSYYTTSVSQITILPEYSME